MAYLTDVNVWIALTAARHVHHRTASQWFKGVQDDRLAFCRITQMGFLRLLTNKHVMQEEVMNPDQAWRAYRVLRSDWRIGYLTEPNELREEWDLFTQSRLTSPNLWTDAYLCAFASAGRLTLVTFDSKIPAWENVKCLVLSGGS
jgi:toxin-antitoxin system PIN domain toxin